MAGIRLEYWDTLPREELQRRVQEELTRRKLTFVEQQLLDAAQERLRTWRTPHRSREVRGMRRDDEDIKPDVTEQEQDAPAEKKERSKVKRGTSKVRSGKKRNAAGKTSKKAAKASTKTRTRIDPDAKVVRTGKDNPFREGSDSFKRVEIVFKSSGQSAGTIMKKTGVRTTTLPKMKKLGLIDFK
jgi:hypothetical protein